MVEHRQEGITLPDDDAPDVSFDLRVYGEDEDAAEKVLMHAKDEGIRAMQALHENEHPDEVDGGFMSVAWDRVVEDGGDD